MAVADNTTLLLLTYRETYRVQVERREIKKREREREREKSETHECMPCHHLSPLFPFARVSSLLSTFPLLSLSLGRYFLSAQLCYCDRSFTWRGESRVANLTYKVQATRRLLLICKGRIFAHHRPGKEKRREEEREEEREREREHCSRKGEKVQEKAKGKNSLQQLT